MGRVRLPFIVIRYIEISFKVGLTVYPPDLAITHVGSECDSLNVFRLLTDFVYLYTYEFWLSLCKIVRSSVILLLSLFNVGSKCDSLKGNRISVHFY